MIPKDQRRANLMRASAMTRVQDNQIQNTLNNMSNEELENFISSNPEYADMLSIDADSNTDNIVINYADQPNHQHQDSNISIAPPWEFNFAAAAANQQPNRVNLFQVGMNPSTGMSYGGYYNNYYQSQQQDERLVKYTNGMRMYNINPYNFPNANMMIDYFNYCEQQREFAANQQYGWALLSAKFIGTKEAYEWAEQFKFKPADQMYNEQQETQAKAKQERMQLYKDENNDIVYDMYDCNGIRYQRAYSFEIIDVATGKVVDSVNYKKDKLGQSYTTHTMMEDRKERYENQRIYNEMCAGERYKNIVYRLWTQSYVDNKNKWQSWKDEGLSEEEMYARYEDERIDWKAHARMVDRALRSASFSKQTFGEILSACCEGTDLTYGTKSKFFNLSYDFARDLHYKELTSTPEEMNTDPMVHQKLLQEYEIKRKMFMDKVLSGNLAEATATDAHYKPTFPKTPIDELTLEDYKKPENQFMYTKAVTPEISTENMFIPPDLSGGGIIPESRTFGVVTVDDDTGEIISQYEEDVTDEMSGYSSSTQLTDDEIANLF